MPIYLDYNAGAPLRPEARAALELFLERETGNPASVHRAGQFARRMLERAREAVAELIGAAPATVVFTSGGTEANNLAILGSARARPERRRVVSSAIEHSSILAPLAWLEASGFEVIRLAPDREGRVVPEAVAASLDDKTCLLSLGLANSEVGTLQEAGALASLARRTGASFHLDAVQAVGRVGVDVAALGCDLLTISGHKLGAPAGTGALYLRPGTPISPTMLGGPQESAMRAGTPNLCGAVALGAVAQALSRDWREESERVERLTSRLLEGLRARIFGLRLNGPEAGRVPGTLNLTFPLVAGESLLIALDLAGVEVSMGSACAAGAVEPSHVLLAMGLSPAAAQSSLRLSLGWQTTAEEVDRAVATIARLWRQVSRVEGVAAQEAEP